MFRASLSLAAGLLLACCAQSGIDETFAIPRVARAESDPRPDVRGLCDPLVANGVEIELAQPLAVGRAGDGRLFVVDAVGGTDMRTFRRVPGRDILERQSRMTGALSDQDYLWFQAGEEERLLLLRVERKAWHAGFLGPRSFAMWLLAPEHARLSGPEMAQAGEPLQVLSSRAVSGWKIRNYPQRIDISYLAETDDGRWLLVTRADRLDETVEHVRVFFGPEEAVQERQVVSFGRALDGGSAVIEFASLGDVARVRFPVMCGGALGLHRCPGTLKVGERELTLRQHDLSMGIPAGLQVVCGSP